MALEGNVKDFGLSEILQLVALQKKAGMLSIEGEQAMVIYFQEGLIVSTRDRRRMANDPLRDYILRYGLLGTGEMRRIDRIQAETNLDLTDILISEKKFSEDELREIFAEQIQESLQEVLIWPKSQYRFIIGSQVLQGVRSFGGFKVEGLLMESMRRIDEMPELLRIFPSDETILNRLPPPEGQQPQLEQTEEEIQDLLTDGMTLGELVSRGRMPRFCAMETLKQLLEKGLLQVTPVEKSPAPEEECLEEETEEKRPSRRMPALAAAGALIACFVFGEIAVPRLLPPGWSFRRREAATSAATAGARAHATDLEEIRNRLLEQTIREELEEHFALTGAYPPSLETLVSQGLLTRKSIARAAKLGFSYRLERGGKRYALERGRP